MADSILNDVKKMLGMPNTYTPFDTDVIIQINSALTNLWDFGIGPGVPLVISGAENTWDELNTAEDDPIPVDQLGMVKTYLYLKVRMAFDPPTMGFLVDAIKSQIEEHEYRLIDRRESLIPRTVPESEVNHEWHDWHQ